jgi:hypothetical protein
MNYVDAAESKRFLAYVSACGGGEHTDCLTLAYLYDIWTQLGLRGATSETSADPLEEYDESERRTLRSVSVMWGGKVIEGRLTRGRERARLSLGEQQP